MIPPITINFTMPTCDDETPIATIDAGESLRRWGTVAFGLDFMRDMIRIGDPEVLELADGTQRVIWHPGTGQINAGLFMEFVPVIFHALAIEAIRDALKKNERRHLTPHALQDFIVDANRAVQRRLLAREVRLAFADEWLRIGGLAMRDAGATDVEVDYATRRDE